MSDDHLSLGVATTPEVFNFIYLYKNVWPFFFFYKMMLITYIPII